MAKKEEFDISEFFNGLNRISKELQTGDGKAYSELRDFLRPYEDRGIFEFSASMPKFCFIVLWQLTRFVFHELEDNFGGDTPGFPIKEGLPRLCSIFKGLGHYIQEAVFSGHYSISHSYFMDAFAAYADLVRMINKKEISSFDPEDWSKL
jgi:hypothetical protein